MRKVSDPIREGASSCTPVRHIAKLSGLLAVLILILYAFGGRSPQ